MILGDGTRTDGKAATFDALFRRAGVRHPDKLALVDAPNRTDRPPRSLTYGEADRVISGVASRLIALGLMTDSIVAVQLGNTVESVITLLGVVRAGMIAVPLPTLWRKQDMVEALSPLGPRAIITTARIGTSDHIEVAMRVAAELFPVRYVCAFGNNVPDGVVPFDDLFAAATSGQATAPRREHAGSHVAVVTMEVGAKGPLAVARSQSELLAGGLAVVHESGAPEDDVVLSTIPVASFAGIATALVPWLVSGGTLHLHHGFDAKAFIAQCAAASPATIVVPGSVVEPLREARQLDAASRVVALWRAPERMAAAAPWQGKAKMIDVAVLGEAAIVANGRNAEGLPHGLPLGDIRATGLPETPLLLETKRTKSGMLAVRGPMVPLAAFPPGIEDSGGGYFDVGKDRFVNSGFMCRLDKNKRELSVTGKADGLAAIGGYSLRPADIEARLAKIDADATLMAVPDALLGQRLAAQGRERTGAFLQAFGLNALVSGAFRKRKPAA